MPNDKFISVDFNRQRLSSLLNTVSPAIKPKSPKEVLQYFRLFTERGKVHLYATDLEFYISAKVCDAEEEFDCLLPNRITRILNDMQGENVTLDVSRKAIKVRSSLNEVTLQTQEPGDYPTFPKEEGASHIELKANELKNSIQRTAFSTAVADRNTALEGLLISCGNDSTEVVSTDGCRLSLCRIDSPHEATPFSGIIPKSAIQAIERSISDQERAAIQIGVNTCVASLGDLTIGTRLISGRFPNWEQVVPSPDSFQANITVSRSHLLSAVHLANSVCNAETSGITFTISEAGLHIDSSGKDVGKSNLNIPVDYQGESVSFCLNGKYVAQWLKISKAESIHLSVIDSSFPIQFLDQRNVYIVMPMREE